MIKKKRRMPLVKLDSGAELKNHYFNEFITIYPIRFQCCFNLFQVYVSQSDNKNCRYSSIWLQK